MKTPPITLAQITSYIAVAAAVLLKHYGWMTTDEFFGICGVAGIHIGADGFGLRPARAKIVAAQHLEQAAQLKAYARDGVDQNLPTLVPGASAPAA